MQSLPFGPGLRTLVAGVPASVYVQPADAWGNARLGQVDRLWLLHTARDGVAVRTAMGPADGGGYEGSFSAAMAGQQAVAVSVAYDTPQVRRALSHPTLHRLLADHGAEERAAWCSHA